MERRKLIEMLYLAGPYTHPDPEVREARTVCVTMVAARLMKEGRQVFSPLTYTHQMNLALQGRAIEFSHWEEFDLFMLDKCDEMAILRIPGWEIIKGVTAEALYARRWDIPVTFIDPTPEELLKAGITN